MQSALLDEKVILVRKGQKDYIGERIGQLTVLEELEPHVTPNGTKQRIVKCRCSCGNTFMTRLTGAIKKQKCRKCLDIDRRSDITGKRFGKLLVLSMAEDYYSPSGHRLSRCNCLCDCGNTTVVNMSSLVSGKTRSCGCLQNTKGLLQEKQELVDKYDFEKNAAIGVDFGSLTARSSKKVWWKCDVCGNSWFATIASQNDTIKHGCPYCARERVAQKNAEKRKSIRGLRIVDRRESNEKRITSESVIKSHGIASGYFKTKASKIGSLTECYPDLIKEWDYEKNDIDPSDIPSKSNLRVWWKCSEGHEWQATIANRTYNNSGCPRCRYEDGSSFCEQAVYYYVKKAFPDAVNGDMHLDTELDIFIPSINTAIEYDGEAWHNSTRRIKNDIRKNDLCKKAGIRIIRIREPKLPEIDNCISFVREDSISSHSLDSVISDLLRYLGKSDLIIDTDSESGRILAQYAAKKHDNSLAVCFPEIAKEWHPTKNGGLTPDKINKASRRTVWWLGDCGHEWKMMVNERTRQTVEGRNGKLIKARGCPYCASKQILIGFNDLQTKYPDIAAEWHPTKNGSLKPSEVMPGSNKKVWWLGKCGHEWQATPDKRVYGSGQCPICFKEKRSPAVVCVETGIIYESGADAVRSTGKKNPRTIYRNCRQESKSAYGYHWRFLRDD